MRRILFLLFLLFPSSALAVPSVVVVRGTLSSDSGSPSRNFTYTDFNTPSGAFVITSYATSATASVPDIIGCFGFWDGTTQVNSAISISDGIDTTATSTAVNTDSIAEIYDADAATLLGKYLISNTTDGVTITLQAGDSLTSDIYCTVVLFSYEYECDADVVTVSATQSATTDQNNMTNQPDFVMFGQLTSTANLDTYTNHARINISIAVDDGSLSQKTLWCYSQNGSNFTNNIVYYRDANIYNGDTTPRCNLTAFNTTGFTISRLDATGTEFKLPYLAVYTNGDGISLKELTARTTTGNDTTYSTGIGFQPGFFMGAMNNVIASNNDEPDISYSVGVTDGTTESSIAFQEEDALDTSDPNSQSRAKLIDLMDPVDGTEDIVVTLDSFGSDGWTLSYDTVNGTAYVGWGFAIEASTQTPIASTESSLLFSPF